MSSLLPSRKIKPSLSSSKIPVSVFLFGLGAQGSRYFGNMVKTVSGIVCLYYPLNSYNSLCCETMIIWQLLIVWVKGWQTFLNGQRVNILGLQAMWSLSQPIIYALVAQKSQSHCINMGMAEFQENVTGGQPEGCSLPTSCLVGEPRYFRFKENLG